MANRRPPFTADEKLALEEMILSKQYTDAEIAKRLRCSKTTIKLIRTRKYRILKKKRRKYDDAIKQTMFIMYREDNLKIIDIARRLRIRYNTVWETLERAGIKEPLEKKPLQRIKNKVLFNYSFWLFSFLKYLEKKTGYRNRGVLIAWMHLPESQKILAAHMKEFNDSKTPTIFYKRGSANGN
jgi:transposase-like protein